MSATSLAASVAPRGGLARSLDVFFYKRLTDAEATRATMLGAACSMLAVVTAVALLYLETLAFLSPAVVTTVALAPHSTAPLAVTFNITFPALPCHLLSLDLHDALGLHAVNVSAPTLHKFRIDAQSGRALFAVPNAGPLTVRYGDGDGDKASNNNDGGSGGEGSTQLTAAAFEPFVAGTDMALITYGAPWCPWSRRLVPVWEEVARVVSTVPGVRLGRVDCTDMAAVALCQRAHVAAYPTILLYKGGVPHSHSHYHGDRTTQALLNFLVAAQRDEELVTATDDGSATDPHAVVERVARQLHLLGEEVGGQEHAGHDHGAGSGGSGGGEAGDGAAAAAVAKAERDPADPGAAQRLVEAMHRAGLHAPGDAARAAKNLVVGALGGGDEAAGATPTAAPSPGADGACANGTDGGAAAVPRAGAVVVGDAGAAVGAEGCQMAGYIEVKRVPGSLVFSPAVAGMSLDAARLNTSHIVSELFFGPRVSAYQLGRLPPGMEAELHAMRGRRFVSTAPRTSHEHWLSVVPSSLHFLTGHTVETYTYTANDAAFEDARVRVGPPVAGGDASADGAAAPAAAPAAAAVPLARFSYSLSPLAMAREESRKPFYAFLTTLCAIIGGVFTVINVLDSLLHTAHASLRYKLGIGKQS